MPMVAVAKLKPGATLSQAVYSPRGLLLAPAGTVLTAAHLATFASWGVDEVDVVADDAIVGLETPRVVDEQRRKALSARLDERFRVAEPLNAFMREVRRVAEDLLIEREGI